jgi:hypothetical protein
MSRLSGLSGFILFTFLVKPCSKKHDPFDSFDNLGRHKLSVDSLSSGDKDNKSNDIKCLGIDQIRSDYPHFPYSYVSRKLQFLQKEKLCVPVLSVLFDELDISV